MNVLVDQQIIFCFRFMRFFGIGFFSLIRVQSECLGVLVAWQEDCYDGIPEKDDVQEVLWLFDSDPALEDALIIGEFVSETGGISSDRIMIKYSELERQFDWDSRRIRSAAKKLLSIKVKMIDDGKESDFFMLHPVTT